MTSPAVHVVGAGLAGLAAAAALVRTGRRVIVHEASPQAGGRCRSFIDSGLGCLIDNGSHLVIGANRQTLGLARLTGGLAAMIPMAPRYDFMDLPSRESWSVTPWRLLLSPRDTLRGLGWRGGRPDGDGTVLARLGASPRFERLWHPLCQAMLNTPPGQASAPMFARVLHAILAGGPGAMTPWRFPRGLSAALVDPTIAYIRDHGGEVRLSRRLEALAADALIFADEPPVTLGRDDRTILALPPWEARRLLPHLPDLPTQAIVNAHFRPAAPEGLARIPDILGLTGGTAQWLFHRGGVVSVTVSAADRLLDQSPAHLAAVLWSDVTRALRLPATPPPPCRVVKERRATLRHDPATLAARPSADSGRPRLILAGDWINSPWPCTVEAAIVSGLHAARRTLDNDGLSFTC